eukprot:3622470-Alexandrium_andersonii.AAC.1
MKILARARNEHALFTHTAIGTPRTCAQRTAPAPETAAPAPGTELRGSSSAASRSCGRRTPRPAA